MFFINTKGLSSEFFSAQSMPDFRSVNLHNHPELLGESSRLGNFARWTMSFALPLITTANPSRKIVASNIDFQIIPANNQDDIHTDNNKTEELTFINLATHIDGSSPGTIFTRHNINRYNGKRISAVNYASFIHDFVVTPSQYAVAFDPETENHASPSDCVGRTLFRARIHSGAPVTNSVKPS